MENTKREQNTVRYNGSPGQDARINNSTAKLNKDGTITYLNINQFTEADAFVKENINKYGKENVTFVGHSLGGGLAEYYAVQYDADAVTFASADVYDLLSDGQKKNVKNGAYRDKIISYTHPDDIVGSWYDEAIGSTYYMSDPYENNRKTLSTHGINKNFAKKSMFNKDGYYLPEILYDETSYAQLLNSPLELKNTGVSGFSILIKSAILTAYALDIKKNVSLIEGTRNSLDRFYHFYVEELLNLKQKYLRSVGSGSYDLLSSADVEEIFSAFGKQEEGVPIIFDTEQYEDIMTRLNHLMNDTDEIAYHMDKMGKDFDKKDQELAQWLGLK